MGAVADADNCWGRWKLRGASLLAFAMGWEALARAKHSLLLPTFSATMDALVRLLGRAETWRAFFASNQALVTGFGLAAVIGVPTGLLLGRFASLAQWTDVYLTIALATPTAALIPLLVMAAGLGLTSRSLVVFVFSVAVIIVNTRAGLRQLSPSWLEMARSFGANEKQLWRTVLLPGALPEILAALRLGLGRAVTGMVVVELLLSAVGLGRLIMRYQGDFEAAYVYALILLVLAEAVALSEGIKRLERWLLLRMGSGVEQ
jgi:ABC-type nitrate/sulfonate/bicarbonate transport system permease component